MNNIKKYLFISVGIFLFPLSVFSQSLEEELLEDDGFDIVEAPQDQTQGGIGRYISGSLGYSVASADNIDRKLSTLNLGIDAPLGENIRAFFQLGAISYENTYTLNRREGTNSFLSETRKIIISDDRSILNEGFFQWEASDFMLISAGRERLAWGQFNLFSPVSFSLLPNNTISTSLRSTKSDLTYPQDVLRLNIFPLSNLEFQGYFFPGIRLDPAIEESFEISAAYNVCPSSPNSNASSFCDDSNLPDTSELDQSALRILFYADWGVLGITHFQGYDIGIFPSDDSRVTRSMGTLSFAPGKLFYPEIEANALEISVPIGEMNYKFEYLSYDTLDRIEGSPDLVGFASGNPELRNLLNIIVDNNDGSVNVDITTTVVSLGFDYSGTLWTSSFQLVNLSTEGISEQDKALLEERDRIRGDEGAGEVFPIFSAIRTIGETKQAYAGMVGGAVSQGFGFGFIFGKTFAEKIDVGGFIGVIDYFDTPSSLSSSDYESLGNSGVTQFGVNYRF